MTGFCEEIALGSAGRTSRTHPQMEERNGRGTCQSLKISQAKHVWSSEF